METIELRDYQQKQLAFLKSNIDFDNGRFNKNIGLMSPTGSGKSITMLGFVQDYFAQHNTGKVYIATGFNNLVYQFYNQAKRFGIPCQILIGRNHCACTKKIDGINPISDDIFSGKWDEYHPKTTDCEGCELINNGCYFDTLFRYITQQDKILVITNHAMLLNRATMFSGFNFGFIDECQVFPQFYENHIGVNIEPYQLYRLSRFLENNDIADTETLRNHMDMGELTTEDLQTVLSLTHNGRKLSSLFQQLNTEVAKWNRLKDNKPETYYLHSQLEDDKFVGVHADVFFDKVEVPTNVCITSATVDTYTRNVFSVSNVYEEKNYGAINYEDSNLYLTSEKYNIEEVEKFVEEQTAQYGLIISTRLDLVKELKQKKHIGEYEIVDSLDDFKQENKKQILVGSNKLFQGVDIYDIGFIVVNKLPFERYDFSYRKKMAYFDSLSKNSYTYYTVPSTTNRLTQIMGRMWRKAGDAGNILLFEALPKNSHKQVIDAAVNYRPGLNVTRI